MAHLTIQPGNDLQSIFDSAPEGAELFLLPGEYRCKTVIRRPGLTVTGAGPDKTVLIWNDYARKRHADGREYNTFRTWTAAVCAPGVTMKHLAIVNDALSPETKGQELALSVSGDNFTMENCLLRSTQDTLFLGPLPRDLIERYDGFLPDELRADRPLSQRFTDCRIEGTVDFIFGCGNAVFERCELRSLFESRSTGYIAAPAHAPEQDEGFLFRRCRFTCAATVPPGSVYLARPWRDFGIARFVDCSYGKHIAAGGFDPWNDTERDQTARFYETPAVPGRVPWCNRT